MYWDRKFVLMLAFYFLWHIRYFEYADMHMLNFMFALLMRVADPSTITVILNYRTPMLQCALYVHDENDMYRAGSLLHVVFYTIMHCYVHVFLHMAMYIIELGCH